MDSVAYVNPTLSNFTRDNLIIVIDDDEIIRLSCKKILEKSGYRVEVFDNGHDGIRRVRDLRPPVLVVDIKIPGLDGFEVIKTVRDIDPDVVIVVITGYATIETAVDAMKAGAYDFLPKPFTPSELRILIDRGCERWRLTKDALRLRREKEEVERKFVTLVSHQLKGPLVAVKQYLDVLLFSLKDELPVKALEWITRSQIRLGEMLTIIQDWLALARIDHGAFCEKYANADLAKVVADIIREQEQLPLAASVHFDVTLPPGLPRVSGDPVSISMLVSNLVGNAVKYNNPGGSVIITAAWQENFVTLRVSDTGIGIPKECIPRLFQEFYRVKTRDTQDIPGTGLGLVICKRIVTELGGSIEVESRQGAGTTFLVELPVAEAEAEAQSDVLLKSLPGETK
jgi:two-component system sensor histidine kinase/response regulator